ncbi:MAG: RNA-binding S4 domain-containing protein [Gammaproteobacteria bacterium]|nr:RNA-binding S4 domain-containing protein [Gammaproteobacteria bacterium]
MQIFDLQDHEFIELNKLLKITGLCESGGEANHAIVDGEVTVDGRLERRKRCKIRSGQTVECRGQAVRIG